MSEPLNPFWLLFINGWSFVCEHYIFVQFWFSLLWTKVWWVSAMLRRPFDQVLCWLLYQVFFLPSLSVIVRVARRQTDSFKILSSFPICQPAIQWHWCVQVARISWQQLTKDGAVHWSWVLLARASYPAVRGCGPNVNPRSFVINWQITLSSCKDTHFKSWNKTNEVINV